ncbi:ABC transporter ATP-binding protein [Hoeflea prorocentri]|uniref:ABC transporter ATP-binding protein n=1 Tax=Hoeflea prorocentri TaxID=1922333 RepID=A0A9X3UFB4_9HYPH|nr:ABC transporter ATP-binding protein [Hoeflea prorocentri]MCY6379778.1 ABC transporter ATP-binding protein [Hoeflea prorocentri]MDA5397578.1 ABC transporter ATP-binding protein [Hoeflea prorocentri]
MNVLTVENLSKTYGMTQALNDVSFECKEGEFFTLFGPSGAGKTTILELIAGMKSDYQGRISIRGRPLEGMAMQNRNIAMAFEDYALYPHMTVEENISFPLRSPRAPKRSVAEIRKKVQWTADELDIGHLLERNPVQLSGGQKQRVALARALVREADVYLLDEPIAHLDAKLRTVARANLKAMANNLGATIIYVTHDFREALGLSDRLLILNQGKVLQIDEPRKVYAKPATDFVGRLLGDPVMNMVDGLLRKSENGMTLLAGGVTLKLNAHLSQEAEDRLKAGSDKARLGIRPSGVQVHLEDPGNATALPVYTIEHSADHLLVYFEIAGVYFGGICPAHTDLSMGQQVWIRLDENRGHLFDATFDLDTSSVAEDAA